MRHQCIRVCFTNQGTAYPHALDFILKATTGLFDLSQENMLITQKGKKKTYHLLEAF
jgi:hypothetical protein